MRNWLALLMVGAVLSAIGCAGNQTRQQDAGSMEKKEISRETHVVCPGCGKEFTVGEGLDEWEKLH